MTKSKSAKKKKKPKLTPAQIREKAIQRQHIREVRTVFRNSGFIHIPEFESKDLEFDGAKTDFDDLFVLENVVILLEYTTSNESHVGDHLLKKNIPFTKINANPAGFVAYLRDNFKEFRDLAKDEYNDHHYKVAILYASRYPIKPSTKSKTSAVIYFDYAYLKYFVNVSSIVKNSSKFEILEFLGVKASEFAESAITTQDTPASSFKGSVLPEAHSHFPPGYKVVSFYVDPKTFLERAYVLRRDGWRSEGNIYQRMISRSKIIAIRKHLLEKKGVFINNIIVTLPDGTQLLDAKKKTIETSEIKKTEPGIVSITSGFNSIGIVDGQHRVFSYYEGGPDEAKIKTLRIQQNLLATGILFPEGTPDSERVAFEARLFLEINSNQSSAKADLKQEIGLILKPSSTESIARTVLNRINDGNGPLGGEFQKYFWETNKMKTTTVVNYQLRPLVRVRSKDNLWSAWPEGDKDNLADEKLDADLLESYIAYCVKQTEMFISAAKANLPDDRWTADPKVKGRLLTTTIVNGLIACLRQIVKNNKMGDFEIYKDKLQGLAKFSFETYKSSGYNELGVEIAKKHFAIAP